MSKLKQLKMKKLLTVSLLGSLIAVAFSLEVQAMALKNRGIERVWSFKRAKQLPRFGAAGKLRKLLIAIDPPPSSIFNGQVALYFNPSLLQVESFGWFGGFGIDPNLPSPAVGSGDFLPENTPFILQAPNPQLTQDVIVDNIEGNLVATFDWGSDGFQPSSPEEDFNFFGIEFVFEDPEGRLGTKFVEPGAGDVGLSTLPGANFYNCTPIGSEVIQSCSVDKESRDLLLVPVPESDFSLSLLALGTLSAGSALFSQKRFSKKS
ncbi:hypothetical protein [Microcystis aeruginosa]|uniref:hypothetical protein n=1 Tax=Microcystis aeruginosa TaxID=1126 RepID=UPI00232FA6F4|nr:hypothetical protein [Microcystis aeruginosa]